jgi:hypothetical protein
MTESERGGWALLRRMIDGYQLSQAIAVAVDLGIADALAGEPRHLQDLSAVPLPESVGDRTQPPVEREKASADRARCRRNACILAKLGCREGKGGCTDEE